MGKIGDLFVRLGLKSDDYKKGIKEAKNETEGFSKTLSNLKVGALAVWAAIGAGVTKLGHDIIRSTNAMSDAFDQMTSSWKASYTNALAEISAKAKKGGWLRFFNLSDPSAAQQVGANAKAAGDAAAEATKAFDAKFELVNSVKLQRLAVQQQLNELYIAMRDTTLSPADRQAAADKYKAILQPIADAEVKVYGQMLGAAIDQWQAGVDLDRVYSVDEITEFFSKIGTEAEKMAEKFPDLMRVYETRKGDKTNQPLFDILATYQQATNQMSDIERILSRTTNSIKAQIHQNINDFSKWANSLSAQANNVKNVFGEEAIEIEKEIQDMLTSGLETDEAEIEAFMENLTDEWLTNLHEFIDEYAAEIQKIEELNNMLEQSFISSFSNGMQALADFAMGVEGTNWEQVLAAFIQPLADTMRQMGELFIAEGIAMEAFKESMSNPYALIAAGAALIAVSAVVTAGLKKLTANPAGGSTSASVSNGTSTSGKIEKYEQEITVHVVGEISGDKIILAGQKTLNKWNR